MSAPERVPRLLALLPWLVAHPGVTVDEVARHFDVTAKEVLADISLLTMTGPGRFGGELVDIDITGDRIHVTDPQSLKRPLRLTADEATALLVGVRMLAQVPGVADRGALASAADKLSDAVAGNPAVHVAVAAAAPDVAADVTRALSEGRAIRLEYLNANRDEQTDRVVDPLRMLVLEGRTYLEAWCRRAEAVRTFRLDRIAAAEVLAEPAAPPVGVLAADVEAGRLVPEPTEATEEVTFLLGERGRWVSDQVPLESATETAEGLLVRLLATDQQWVVRLALALGGDGQLLGPDHYVAAVRRAAAAALSAYGE